MGTIREAPKRFQWSPAITIRTSRKDRFSRMREGMTRWYRMAPTIRNLSAPLETAINRFEESMWLSHASLRGIPPNRQDH